MPEAPSNNTRSLSSLSGLPSTTPMPNQLLDEWMPLLGDTQWRLLCVIVRQTMGWSDPTSHSTGGRKTRDWLTHSQLKTRTGRASAALSAALDDLVQRGLVEVQDERGRVLCTPAERRRARGRLYYRLHPRLGYAGDFHTIEQVANRPLLKDARETSQSEFHKTKTTKENETKDFINIEFSQSEEGVSKPASLQDSTETNDSMIALEVIKSTTNEGHEEATVLAGAALYFVSRYREQYLIYHGGKETPPISEAGWELLHRHLSRHSIEQLEKWLPAFFESTFGYVRRRNYSLESFLNSLHILQTAQNAQRRTQK